MYTYIHINTLKKNNNDNSSKLNSDIPQSKLADSVKTSLKEGLETNPAISALIAGIALTRAYMKWR